METLIIISTVIASVSIGSILTNLYLTKKKNESKGKIIAPPRDLNIILSYLDGTIEREVTFRLKIEYEIKKSAKVFKDFDGEMKYLTKIIVNAFSINFMNELEYYYTKDYILRYIVKNVELSILKYMDESRPR